MERDILKAALLGISKSGYYGWLDEPETARDRRDRNLTPKVKAIFKEHRGRYGSPRVDRALHAKNATVNEKRVARFVRENGLVSRPKNRFVATTDSTHKAPIAPNLLARNITTQAPNRAWVTDVTAIWTHVGCLYLASIIDLFSRRVVGWATSETNDRFLAMGALRAAVGERRPERRLLHHSDRGSPYASDDYRAALAASGMRPSMSREGNCRDNSVAESFFSTLKTEAFGDHVPADRSAAKRILGEYIDGYCNVKRIHSFLDYETPIEFELKKAIAAKAAA